MGKYDKPSFIYPMDNVVIDDEYKDLLIRFLMCLLKDSRYLEFHCETDKSDVYYEMREYFDKIRLNTLQDESTKRVGDGESVSVIRLQFIRTIGELMGEEDNDCGF